MNQQLSGCSTIPGSAIPSFSLRSTKLSSMCTPLSPPAKPCSRSVRPGPAGARILHASRILACGGCAVLDSWIRGPLEISPNCWLISKHKVGHASTASRRCPFCLGIGASPPTFLSLGEPIYEHFTPQYGAPLPGTRRQGSMRKELIWKD
ncbi:hypothetical protein N8I77_009305 [Diaporthe amygdali]|uniref:Uncharacterized protein n=1 Tax=Phomopsis amygdali TaxID=1214568 RepID=A0AAD9SAZ3_PHOAM|nr:hypothetical protein N8I77_009305 [Diaporthe amygdali]